MRWFLPLCLCLVSLLTVAGDNGELRLIQAQADLPKIDLWLDLPTGNHLLKADQFSINIGSHPVEISAIDSFDQSGEGIGYIFLVDVSKSLNTQQFAQIKQALLRWLDGMTPNDSAALISFGSEVKQQLAFSNEQSKLNNAIALLQATDQETNLFRALLEGIALGRSQANGLPTRRAIVVLSDGIDDSVNGVSIEEVLKQSSEYRVPIYSIGFAAPPINDNKRKGLKVLGMLARQSGGHFVQAENGRLDEAYESQFEKITQAYRLRLDCPTCVADGQSYRLNLIWTDGQRNLNDGLDIRLLPLTKPDAAQSSPAVAVDGSLQQIYLLSLAALVIAILLLWFYRRRQLALHTDEAVFLAMAAATATDEPDHQAGFGVSLTTISGKQKGQRHRLRIVSSAIIGRLPNCELCLEDSEISAQHAVLRVVDNRLTVRDLRSTNGTLVNGVPIHNEYPLRNGDLLLLGRTELRVELP